MVYLQIFWAFFIANILGYGGGPATIPLIEQEAVNRYNWVTTQEFSEILAMANALPGPIAAKMAGYIGFSQAGVVGSCIAVFATVAPSVILLISLMNVIYKYRNSPRVKRMTLYVKPTIAVLLGILAFNSLKSAYFNIGIFQMLLISIISYILLDRIKVHPSIVIVITLVYGAIFL